MGRACGCRCLSAAAAHRCKGCFNAELRSFDYGMPYTQEIEDEVMEALNKSYIAGLTFLGGEPMEPENQPFVCKLAEPGAPGDAGKDDLAVYRV